jgi:2-succinyl-6-hydroxy-2,4-cyclohexadiene-1-carboxylate synthase
LTTGNPPFDLPKSVKLRKIYQKLEKGRSLQDRIKVMPTIHFDGVACDYALSAPRPNFPVLVFVHGWLLSRAYWQPVVDLLAPEYQCLTYDLRGFGRSGAGRCWNASSAAASPYDLQAYAEDLLALLEHLQIQRAWVVGHSLGGSVALWAAHLAPKVVEGVVCVNAGGGIYLQTEFEKFRRAGEQMVQLRPGWLRYVPGWGWRWGGWR